MKKFLFSALAAMAAMMTVSCEGNLLDPDGNGDNGGTNKPEEALTINVSVKVDGSEIKDITLPETFDVSIINFNTAEEMKAKTENGIAVFEKIVPGIYKVTATATTTANGFAYTITGANEKAEFLNDKDEVVLKLAAAKESALVFKEIYYAGCKIGDGEWDTYFRDQFYEIYNNSNETVYVDGLCLAETKFSKDVDFTFKLIYDVPNPDEYVFSQKVWQLPGEGTDYPVKPGESIVIAQWGTDHTDASLSNGKSPVNLKGADFEAFVKAGAMGSVTLTDEAAINMTLAVNTLPYMPPMWLTPVSGSRYIIFKPSTPLRTSDFLAPTNYESTMDNVVEIKIADIIDGVEAVENEKRFETLGLPDVIDAGAIYLSAPGSYNGESIVRKVKETLKDGRIIYQDTNNTSNDFEVSKKPVVRRNGAKVPAWNTWSK